MTTEGKFPKINLPWVDLTTRGQFDIAKVEEDMRYLNHLDFGGDGTRWGTIVIAASDSTSASKDKADYLCSANASLQIQTAVNKLVSRGRPGRIVFLEGTYTIGTTITVSLTAGTALSFEGLASGMMQGSTLGSGAITGGNTLLKGAVSLFTISGSSSSTSVVGFQNLAFECTAGNAVIATDKSTVDLDRCTIVSSVNAILLNGGLSGPYAPSSVVNCDIAFGGARGIELRHDFGSRIIGNKITTSGSGTCIRTLADAAATHRALIANNDLQGGSAGIWLNDSTDATNTQDTLIIGNKISSATIGVQMTGVNNIAILSNQIYSCGNAVEVDGSSIIGNHRAMVASNYIYNSTGTAHILIQNSTLGTDDIAVLFNKFRGTTPAYCVQINNSVNDCAFAFNDTFNGFSTARLLDNGNNTRTEGDLLPATLNTNARVGVRKNNGGSTFLRRRIDFIEGADMSISIADDSVDEEVDVTLGLPSTVNTNARVGVRKNSTGSTFLRRRINFIEGSSVTLSVTDDVIDEEVDVTINLAGGGGGGNTEGQFIAGFDGGGNAIATGKIQDVQAPFAGTINSWAIYSDIADTVSVQIWKDVYANYPPTVADNITAAAPIVLTAADHNTSSTLTGWTTAVTAGDILRFKLNTVAVATRLLVVVHYTRP